MFTKETVKDTPVSPSKIPKNQHHFQGYSYDRDKINMRLKKTENNT